MQVLLKIVGGKHSGREIKISVPEFIIGRGDEAHLKPSSEMVSRKHCVIQVKDGKVTVADLNSRNGTFVNDKKLVKPYGVQSGDILRIGRLKFELVLDPVKAPKKPKVKDVVEAANRTAASVQKKAAKSNLEDSISDWLVDEDDDSPFDEQPDFDQSETVQWSAEETQEFREETEGDAEATDDAEAADAKSQRVDTEHKGKGKGKLPPRPKVSHEDSTDAADDILKKLLNRR